MVEDAELLVDAVLLDVTVGAHPLHSRTLKSGVATPKPQNAASRSAKRSWSRER
jgi:hypothetical protein